MKNKFAILAAFMISVCAFAQKEELKTLKKIYAKEQISDKEMLEYKSALSQAESSLASAAEADRVYINFYKAMAPLLESTIAMSKPGATPQMALKYINSSTISMLSSALPAVVDYEKKSGKMIYTKDIEETVMSFSSQLLSYATLLGNQKNYKEAATVTYSVYMLDKTKPDNLYNASVYAVAGGDYDAALKYYDELKAIKYSGEGTIYSAKSLASGVEDSFSTKAERDKMISMKTHSTPTEEKLPSKRGEIYKNIALILVQKGKVDEAKAAIAEAKLANPDDTSLLLTEADLYLTLKDNETYKRLITQVLEKNPNDVDLVYNLGVVNLQAEQFTDAETYFKRALEIDPKYLNAHINLSAIKLKADKKLVDEMNNLGTTTKDNKRYEVLKKERDALFKSALPHLENAYAIDPKNELVIDNMLSVYKFLEMTDKYNALKATKNK